MSPVLRSAGVLALVLVLAERTGTDGAIAQAPPDIAVAIAGVDGTVWQATAIGGHTVAGTYSVANPKRYPGAAEPPPDLGAFTWDGSRLQIYPVVVFYPGIDARPDNAVVAVNSAGVAVGANELSHMSSSGGVEEDRAARFAAGKTTFINQEKPGTGLGRATAVDARGDIVGYTADGLGFFATSTMARSAVAGLTTAAFGAAVVPSAINGHGDIAGTSTTLQTFGNRFDAPNPFTPHVFLAHTGAAAALAQDLGPVPHCQAPIVAGVSDARTIAGMCTSDADAQRQVAWEWNGTFHVLAALPGDDAAAVSAVAPDGIVLGSSLRGDRKTAVLWRNGKVAPISSLTTPAAGDTFEEAVGANDNGWILVRGKRGATATDFLVVPSAARAAAARIAAIPAGPSPTTTDAPPPRDATPAPAPSISRTSVSDAAHASLRAIWSGGSTGDGPVPMASDGTRLYLAVAQSVEAFDARGTLVWKRAFPGATGIAVASGTVVSRGPKSTIGIDAASGALRWSVAHAAAGSSLAVGDGFVGTASGDALQILDVHTGRQVAHAAGGGDCSSFRETGGAFACTHDYANYSWSLTVYDAATGRAMLTLPGAPAEVTTIGSTFYAYASGVIALHPLHRTFDLLTFSGTEDSSRRAAFDGSDVVVIDAEIDGAIARRYRLDAEPSTQRAVAFPVGDSRYVAAGAGVVASFAGPGKPLTIVAFDSAGNPSAVAYAGVRAAKSPGILIRQGLAFAATPGGITIVDLARRRVLGSAVLPCDSLEEALVTGGIAAVGCQTGASHRVSGIDLGR